MKTRMTAIITAFIVAFGMPVLADDGSAVDRTGGVQGGQRAETILEKISRLNLEIEKGASTYTHAELKKLELKLRDAQEILTALNQGG